MRGRLFLAALAAVSLVACGSKAKPGPRTVLVEKDGKFAVAFDDGKQILYLPLPAKPYALSGDKWTPITPSAGGSGGGHLMSMPRCVCGLPECDKFCRPLALWAGGTPGDVDPHAGEQPTDPAAPRLVPAP